MMDELQQSPGSADYLPEYCTKKTLVLGCGNTLFGDDGFGPAVAEYLLGHYSIPYDLYVADAGTGVRKLLFTVCLSHVRPERILIVDAMDAGRKPGELFEVPLDNIPHNKLDDFSLHQAPSSNLISDLKSAGLDVHILGCQIEFIPPTIQTGLSESVAQAVPLLCRRLMDNYHTGFTEPFF
jgi:coenzyme F420 hydrogenase subunit delta